MKSFFKCVGDQPIGINNTSTIRTLKPLLTYYMIILQPAQNGNNLGPLYNKTNNLDRP
jgi:hypothetical protein